jgi:two-component sensor histidine kinase
LATNSAKYGALSHADGHLVVEIIDEGSQVVVAWRETGLPESDEAGAQGAPDTVEREGFGSRLLRTAVEGQLQGKFTRRIVDGMLEVDLELPCDKLQA